MRSPLFEIEEIVQLEIPKLTGKMPYGGSHDQSFRQEGERWIFEFKCNSASGRFAAAAHGRTPTEAFTVAKQMLLKQIKEWRKRRFDPDAEMLATHRFDLQAADIPTRVLIVEDDVDMALAMQEALKQLGCETELATQHEDLHRIITDSNADYIFLDWKLNNQVTAGQVLQKAVRLINTFSDLREKFRESRPRVVTYSVLNRNEVTLPAEGDPYFDHLDHWQKPMPWPELIQRASGLFEVH